MDPLVLGELSEEEINKAESLLMVEAELRHDVRWQLTITSQLPQQTLTGLSSSTNPITRRFSSSMMNQFKYVCRRTSSPTTFTTT